MPQYVIVDQHRRPIEPALREKLMDRIHTESGASVKPRFLILAPTEITVFDLKELTWCQCFNMVNHFWRPFKFALADDSEFLD